MRRATAGATPRTVFPVLFEIPNVSTMADEILVVEIVVGAICFLAWLALRMRKSEGWAASIFSTGAILVGLHLLLSWFMETDRPITIYSFGVVIILGFLAGAWYLTKQTERLYVPTQKVFDWAFWVLVIGILGARLLYAFLNYEDFKDNKLELFRIWNGGLVWYGGLVPAAILGVWLLRRYKLPVLHVSDACAAALMLSLGIGRWACMLAGDDYGLPTDSWLGIRFYHEDSLVPDALKGVALYPTQLFMSVNCLWLFFALEWIRRRAKFAGQAFAWMLILYAVTRFAFIEPFRGDFVERNPSWGKHVAVSIGIERDEGSPAVELERGAAVKGDDRSGRLLADLSLAAGETRGFVWAITDDPAKPRLEQASPLFGAGSSRVPPVWQITEIPGLPATARIVSGQGRERWYHSDLPAPPGYFSTSSAISILIVLAGVGLLLVCRRLDIEGYAEAVRNAEPPPSEDEKPKKG